MIGTGSRFIKTVDDFLTLEGLRIIWERNSGARAGAAAKTPPAAALKKNGGTPRQPATPRPPR